MLTKKVSWPNVVLNTDRVFGRGPQRAPVLRVMGCFKHAYEKGVMAQRGIEY